MRFLTILLILLLLVCSSGVSEAFQIRELRSLDFGMFTIVDPAAHSIVIATNGTTTTPDGGIHKMRGGHSAIFQVTGVDPTTLFYVTIDPTTIAHASGTPVFNIDTFTFDPPNSMSSMVHADPDGSISFYIGATLTTAGGIPATPGPYRGTYNFMINF